MPKRVTFGVWKSEQDYEPFKEMKEMLICNEDEGSLEKKEMVSIAACTLLTDNQIFRLPEWIEYHRLIGFQLLYLYIDSPNIDIYNKFLEKYQQRHPGLVMIFPFYFETGRRAQRVQQYDCPARLKGIAKYVAVFDVDEFFEFQSNNFADLLSFVEDKMQNDNNLAGVFANSLSFSNKGSIPDGYSLIIESFTKRMPEPITIRNKGIFSTNRTFYLDIHQIASGEKQIVANWSDLRLNHYRFPHHNFAWNANDSIVDTTFSVKYSQIIKNELRTSGYCILDYV